MKHIITLLLSLCPMIMYGQNTLSALEGMHSVSKGETWENIAASKGVSIAELQTANPDINPDKKLKKGTLLIIPQKPQVVEKQETIQEPTIIKPVVRTTLSHLKVGVLFTFADAKMVTMYRGLLMAADSIRKSGVDIDIYAWDCGTTTTQIETLLPKLAGLDIIFGPNSATQIPLVAEYCKEQGTRLVLPLWNGQTLHDYPMVYNATAPNTVLYDAAVKKLLHNTANKNFVIVNCNSSDNRGKTFSRALTEELNKRSIRAKSLLLEDDDNAYNNALDSIQENFILLDDNSGRSLSIMMARIKDFRQKHPTFQLSLIGYPEWLNETERHLDNFFFANTYIASPYYYNVLDEKNKEFQRTYEKNFQSYMTPGNPRYAALGFDLGMFFLSGLNKFGDTFEQKQNNLQQNPYQNWYQFERNDSGLSFTNRFVQFIHFTPEKKIELIR